MILRNAIVGLSALVVGAIAVAQTTTLPASTFTASSVGSGYLVTTYSVSGQIIRDSMRYTVIRPPIVSVKVRLRAHSTSAEDTVYVGQSGCVYVFAIDALGHYVTGLHPSIVSSNPQQLMIQPNTGTCSDTTVDPTKVP